MYIDNFFYKLICFFYINKYILLNLLNLEYYKIIYCENRYNIIIILKLIAKTFTIIVYYLMFMFIYFANIFIKN